MYLAYSNRRPYLYFTNDIWQEERVANKDGLCYYAGCKCVDGSVICTRDVEQDYFVEEIYDAYVDECFHTCHCLAVPEEIPANTIQLGEIPGVGNNIHLFGNLRGPNNAVNMNNLNGLALGTGACLAGWTFKTLANKACCSGYTFEALTPQQAYASWGVMPTAAEVIAGVATMGVCVKAAQGQE
ncbi:hypothetical protein MMC14_006030 [Varicellaria rhodocarpa]|nr:hypothetical protein [Varicellaria rhodocarpa]